MIIISIFVSVYMLSASYCTGAGAQRRAEAGAEPEGSMPQREEDD